ncbi:MAG: EamA family transporter RarD [Acidobacteriota bacterium]
MSDERPSRSESAEGILYGVATYGFWGIVAIYFKLVARVPPLEILAHRIIWSVVVLVAIVTIGRRWQALAVVVRSARSLRLLSLSTLLVATNWFIFIWAVTHSHLVEASLGYFINPIVSVLLGYLVLHETLRPIEWVSIALAAAAVTWLAVAAGVFPWISLGVALSFGFYGLVRKLAGVPSLEGLTIETAMLLPVATAFLLFREAGGTLMFGHVSHSLDLLLLAAGPITAIPLIWFASAVRRLRLATVGLLQFITPTIQFALAVALYHESFGREKLVAFVLIWCAVGIYGIANLQRSGMQS